MILWGYQALKCLQKVCYLTLSQPFEAIKSGKPLGRQSMKLHLTSVNDKQLITGYGKGWVEINQVRFTKSLIVMPDAVDNCEISGFDKLTEEHFAQLLALKPEVVLLGTGITQRFIHPRLTRALTEANIGVECMDTAAACRTYNFLMAEDRQVAALLII